jgi:RNA 3'-terminal phosphate cyclase (ATP)
MLLHASEPSEIVFEGGTHNDQAPTFDFLSRVYLPLLRRMGASVDASLERYGFYPAGGGVFRLRVAPSRLAPLELLELGKVSAIHAEALFAGVPRHVATRELAVVRAAFDLPEANVKAREVKSHGPGNVLSITLEREPFELVTSFGRRGVRAEAVAASAVGEAQALLESGAPVGPHLADQLLLPLALAGGGALRTLTPTSHTRTNANVIERFLGVSVMFTETHPGAVDIVVGRPLG